MVNDNKRLKALKEEYENIALPPELDDCIEKAVMKGKIEMSKIEIKRVDKRSNSSSNKWLKRFSGVAAVFIAFTISINTIPSFANTMYDVPGVGKLVQVLHFNRGTVEGGTVTDGTDVGFISLQQAKDEDKIIISFTKEDMPQDLANMYNISYSECPDTMIFTIPGARQFSAEKDFAALKKSEFVKDVYRIMTMDDSMIRFAVSFTGPVQYEVKEFKEPAQLVVSLKESPDTEKQQVYSVRSISLPYGENLGYMEEMLFSQEGLRILKDQEGTYLVEAGYYETEEKAQAKLQELVENTGLKDQLIIEQRSSDELPQYLEK